jgi:hypothetical protein
LACGRLRECEGPRHAGARSQLWKKKARAAPAMSRPRGMQRRFHGCNSTMHGQHELHIVASSLSISQRHVSARRTSDGPCGRHHVVRTTSWRPKSPSIGRPLISSAPSACQSGGFVSPRRAWRPLTLTVIGTAPAKPMRGRGPLRHTRLGRVAPTPITSPVGSPQPSGHGPCTFFPLVMAPLAIDPHRPVWLRLPVTRHPDVVLRGDRPVPRDPHVGPRGSLPRVGARDPYVRGPGLRGDRLHRGRRWRGVAPERPRRTSSSRPGAAARSGALRR